jgi:hypothetical protein
MRQPAPVQTTWRPSAINGLVMQVQNTSDKYLSCKLTVVNLTEHQSQRYSYTLDPYKQTEIGLMECNWAFLHGESGRIEVEGYTTKEFTVP